MLLRKPEDEAGSRVSHFLCVDTKSCSQRPWRLLEDSPDVMDECSPLRLQGKRKSIYRLSRCLAVLNHDRVWQEVGFSESQPVVLPVVEETFIPHEMLKTLTKSIGPWRMHLKGLLRI